MSVVTSHPLKTSDFDYALPAEMIAQTPIEPRDHSRLLVLQREKGVMEHHRFFELGGFLHAGDVLVFNDSRVIPARLTGSRAGSGGAVEILLLRRLEDGLWESLVRPGRRLKPGVIVQIGEPSSSKATSAEVVEKREDGTSVVRFADEAALEGLGAIPLPPYIHAPLIDPQRYQTIYARVKGSVAAPTAGLHFTPELMDSLARKGVRFAFVTLHIGLDTFRPVREDDPREHILHREFGELSPEVARELNQARAEGRRVICVGTTAVRLLEQAARAGGGSVQPWKGWTDLFILPEHHFQAVDALITNFHLPRSTLLMLVSAFAGRELVLRAYQEAIKLRYRFYSFGDAMLML